MACHWSSGRRGIGPTCQDGAVARLDLEPTIELASKLFDSIVPALATVPTFPFTIH